MKIWDYIDPDKAENKIKENTELEIPLIAAVLTASAAPAATSVVLAAASVTIAAAPTALVIAFTALAATPVSTRTAIPALSN